MNRVRAMVSICLAAAVAGCATGSSRERAQVTPVDAPQPRSKAKAFALTALLSPSTGREFGTLAGSVAGHQDGSGEAARFNNPGDMARDAAGNLYVADTENHRIRKVTPQGVVSTLAGGAAGFADGAGSVARFQRPQGLDVDASGNVYVADTGNNRLRKITPDGTVTTLAGNGVPGCLDGPAASATFNGPGDVAVMPDGTLLVADTLNNQIRRYHPDPGWVNPVAGSLVRGGSDGSASSAQFHGPLRLAVGHRGEVYISDVNNHRIRKLVGFDVTTLAGSSAGYADGVGQEARFAGPSGLTVDAEGNLIVCDTGNHRIRKVTGAGGVTTIAGGTAGLLDGTPRHVRFFQPKAVALRPDDDIVVLDGGNHRLRHKVPVRIDTERELVIRALSVVNDPERTSGLGAWTFGKLMADMAGDQDPSRFVLDWLQQWDRPQTVVEGEEIPPRTAMRTLVTEPWLAASGGDRLDLSRAPFRLLAIVNRLDLRGDHDAGEGRFVFGVLDPDGNALPFTVILEYRLPVTNGRTAQTWAEDWHRLQRVPDGPEYNAALQALTDAFAGAGAEPGRPNGSAISQVRTNEVALEHPWQLREFHLGAGPAAALEAAVVAQTPKLSLNETAELAAMVNANEAALLDGTFQVPAEHRTGFSDVNGFPWTAEGIVNNEARHKLALNSCSGCHFSETKTAFTHIAPRQANEEAKLSPFMTSVAVQDPVTREQRSFFDLMERAELLGALLDPAPAPAGGLAASSSSVTPRRNRVH